MRAYWSVNGGGGSDVDSEDSDEWMGVTLQIRIADMHKAWTMWLDNASELRGKKRLLENIDLRMRHAVMYNAWVWWWWLWLE